MLSGAGLISCSCYIGRIPGKEDFIDELHEFLPNIEEMLFKSEDTYLLQYTLMTHGILHEEAMRQACAFPHHAWFSDR